ncbi:hypothetical protein NPIL_70981 [Nephila pilipes]|uniref:Uncharacterized protein n=1 Tax=Nephila pilipes TaxID=299642 RepID=A0A8X6T777_NEPPI|nr:hypothetical protein NPIL_70981 [Nephila pilipes]
MQTSQRACPIHQVWISEAFSQSHFDGLSQQKRSDFFTVANLEFFLLRQFGRESSRRGIKKLRTNKRSFPECKFIRAARITYHPGTITRFTDRGEPENKRTRRERFREQKKKGYCNGEPGSSCNIQQNLLGASQSRVDSNYLSGQLSSTNQFTSACSYEKVFPQDCLSLLPSLGSQDH